MPRISQLEYESFLARRAARGQMSYSNTTATPGVARTTREEDVRRQILDYCTQREWLVFTGSTAHRTHRTEGEPDLAILADRGRTFYAELKRPGGKLSEEQNAVGAKMRRLGHRLIVATTLKEFIEATDTQTN
jgi:VRR-NUC domain